VTYIQYFLIKYQKTDGTLDLENLASQPDTAFILEPICAAALILRKLTMPALSEVKVLLKDSISKSGEAIRSGGVHTPNQH
jgi:hypothetical protein